MKQGLYLNNFVTHARWAKPGSSSLHSRFVDHRPVQVSHFAGYMVGVIYVRSIADLIINYLIIYIAQMFWLIDYPKGLIIIIIIGEQPLDCRDRGKLGARESHYINAAVKKHEQIDEHCHFLNVAVIHNKLIPYCILYIPCFCNSTHRNKYSVK